MGTSFGGEGRLSALRSVCATGFLRAAGLREHRYVRFTMRACPVMSSTMSAMFLAPTRLLARSKLREELGRRWSLQQGLERLGALGDELLGSIGRELGSDQILRRCDRYVDRIVS